MGLSAFAALGAGVALGAVSVAERQTKTCVLSRSKKEPVKETVKK